jgi:hypothetical protein
MPKVQPDRQAKPGTEVDPQKPRLFQGRDPMSDQLVPLIPTPTNLAAQEKAFALEPPTSIELAPIHLLPEEVRYLRSTHRVRPHRIHAPPFTDEERRTLHLRVLRWMSDIEFRDNDVRNRCIAAFLLYLEGKPTQIIAEMLSISMGYVRSCVQRTAMALHLPEVPSEIWNERIERYRATIFSRLIPPPKANPFLRDQESEPSSPIPLGRPRTRFVPFEELGELPFKAGVPDNVRARLLLELQRQRSSQINLCNQEGYHLPETCVYGLTLYLQGMNLETIAPLMPRTNRNDPRIHREKAAQGLSKNATRSVIERACERIGIAWGHEKSGHRKRLRISQEIQELMKKEPRGEETFALTPSPNKEKTREARVLRLVPMSEGDAAS